MSTEEQSGRSYAKFGSGLDLRITLYKLDIFCQVVDAGGVTRAADQLILTQPVVTGHIRSLEERLGVKLFSRSGRHNVLTEAGERTYRWGKEILRATQELHRELEEIGDGSSGSVAIAASMSAGSYLLPPLIAAFAREKPNVQISLVVSDQAGAQEAVRAGDVDFAISIGETPPQPSWLGCETIGEEELIVVAAPGEALVGPLSAAELTELRFVESPMSGRRKLADRRLRDFGVGERRVAVELGHPEAMKRAVEEGVGAAMLFRGAVKDELERGSLVELAIEGVDLFFPVLLMVRTDKLLSHAQEMLLTEIRAACAAPVAVV
jgi:LysR family transcriptional regulator, low CO2-responsive transcriptional regulator